MVNVGKADSIADVGRRLNYLYDRFFASVDDAIKSVDLSHINESHLADAVKEFNLTDDQFDLLRKMVTGTVEPRIGESLKSVQPSVAHDVGKRLLALSQRYKAAPDPRTSDFGHALEQVAYKWRDELATVIGDKMPEARQTLSELNRYWANYAPLRYIAARGPLEADPSHYTPKMLLQAVRAGDKSPNKTGFIERGDLPQQQLAKAGQVVLGEGGSRDSSANLLGTAGLGLGAFLAGPVVTAASLPTSLLYSARPFQRLLQGQVRGQDIVRAATPAVSQFGRAGAEQERQRRERVARQAQLLQALSMEEERRRRVLEQAEALQR
jgi:hypothetical protein